MIFTNPKMEYQVFHCIFQKNLAMATLGLKEFSHFLKTIAIAELFWKMQRKTWYSILGLDTMPLSLKNLLLSVIT